MSRSSLNLVFPTAGVMRRHAFQSQSPYSCFDAYNVLPDDPFLERERGGSRPGIETAVSGNVGGPVQWIGSIGYRDEDGKLRRELCAVGNGSLFHDKGSGLEEVGSGLATDGIITAAEFSGKLYVAGSDANDRIPKVYDPKAETFADLELNAGAEIPKNCRILARYRERLVLTQDDDNPNNVYMSRLGDPTDWDYEAKDAGTAINFINDLAGVVGEPVIAAIEHTDSCMIFACENSVWSLRGDPAQGGYVEKIASELGFLSHQSFCYTPDGWLFAMTEEGLYAMNSSCGGPFASVSREKVPQELRGIDTENYHVSMVYDQGLRGILIFVSEKSATGSGGTPPFGPPGTGNSPPPEGGSLTTPHFFVDVKTTMGSDVTHPATASFWPIAMSSSREPTACATLKGGTGPFGYGMMGTRSGTINRFNNTLESDSGDNFTSYIMYGPIMLGDSFNEGMLSEIRASMAFDSEEVQFELYVHETPEEAVHLDAPTYSGTWTAGSNRTYYPRVRGGAAYIVVRGVNKRFALEGITIVREKLGRRRTRSKTTRGLQGSEGPQPVP